LLQPRINMNEVPFSIHGGINYGELSSEKLAPAEIIDFSTNCNPMGPPPGLRNVIKDIDIDSYPDSESSELREVLANKFRINMDNIIIGSGSTELIRMAASAYFTHGDRVVISYPTYSEYEIACRLAGCEIIKKDLLPENNFILDIEDTISIIKKEKVSGIFICNPNNPTGQYLMKDDVKRVVAACKNCLVIMDEAYIAFTDNTWNSIDLLQNENLVIIRSMTKDFALAGLRAGYALASKEIINVLNRIKPPWNVSSVAQKAALFALSCDEYIEKCNLELKKNKLFILAELEAIGLKTIASQTNFFLVRTGNAYKVRQALLKRGLLVRDCTSFGLPDYIRIATRSIPECKKLISAMVDIGVTTHAC
jgi:histidinol-phosphate aminotransferase